MGSLICALMARKNEASLTPDPFMYKFRYYGVNNEPVLPPKEEKESEESLSNGVSTHQPLSSSCSPVYRMCHFQDDALFYKLCHNYYYGIGNTVTNLRALCVKRGQAVAIAYRPVLRVEQRQVMVPSASTDKASRDGSTPAEGEKVTRVFTHYGERRTLTYEAFWQSIEAFGAGLRAVVELKTIASTAAASSAPATSTTPSLSMPSSAPLVGVDAPRIAIFEETRWEWVTSAFGLWTQGCIAVTVYANLGEDALLYALREADVSGMVCNAQRVPQLIAMMTSGQLPWIPLIYLDALPDSYALPNTVRQTCEAAPGSAVTKGICVPWTAVCELGTAKLTAARTNLSASSSHAAAEASCEWEPQMPTNNDALALIMYTSGTTGNPKGVLHTHGGIMAGVDSLNDKLVWIEPYLPREDLTYCAFLPLAHIMEFVCVNIFLHRGFLVCFSHPRTLTDEFALPHGDFREYKPVILMAVPRIYDVLRKSVLASLPPQGTLKRRLFEQAYTSREAALQRGLDTPFYNRKVFAKVRAAFGGRLVLMLAGGSQLSEATRVFTNVCMGLVVQGYGLTETVACGGTQMIGSLEGGNVGQLMKGCEVKLLDTDQFTHTDKPEPRGEILMRGPFLFKGYYMQPELTKEALDEEGWFHTGDIGAISPKDGVLRIVGRVKALAKNSLGEYITLERLESIYSNNILTQPSGVCVVVHPARNFICALALTDRASVARFLTTHPEVVKAIEAETGQCAATACAYPALLATTEMRRAAAESFQLTAKEAAVPSFEVVRHVRLLDEDWSPENGLLTAALKLKRAVLEEHYQSIIAELFVE